MERVRASIFRLSKALALVFAGFVGGRAFGTFDVYRASRSGDFVDVPPMHLAGIFDIGSVSVSYPGETSLTIGRPIGDAPIQSVWLSQRWGAASLTITCYPGRPEKNDAMFVSDYHKDIGSKLVLWSRGKTFLVEVSTYGKQVKLASEAVGSLIDAMMAAGFPGGVVVAPETGDNAMPRGLYHVPAIGIQNVGARLDRNGHDEGPIPEPPSDPYRVMRKYCR